jgi:hypothetical protein
MWVEVQPDRARSCVWVSEAESRETMLAFSCGPRATPFLDLLGGRMIFPRARARERLIAWEPV